MAKKDDNFDFDTEGKGKLSLDLSFFTNLTKQQKGIILIAAIAVVLVIAIVVTVVLVGAGNGGTNNGGTGNVGGGGNNIGSGNNGGTGEGEDESNVPENVSQISIVSKPVKLVYYVGDYADYTGLAINVTGSQSEKIVVNYLDETDRFTITGFDSSAPAEEQVITVECDGQKVTFTITILALPDNSVKLDHIYIDPLPKTEYKVGESLNLSGAKLIVVYSDGTEVEKYLTAKHISGFNAIKNTPGVHELTVRYFDDNGQDAETTLTITITE